MTRKQLENNRQFQITNAAIDYYRKYKDTADMVSTFEDGAEWADKSMIDKVCKYLYRKLENGKVLSSQLIDNLRKAMGD